MPELDPLRARVALTGAGSATAQLRALSSQTITAEKAIRTAGAAVAGLSAVLAGLSIREAIRFESAMAGVAKTVDGTEEQLAALADQFQELSERIPVSANEMARLGQVAGQLGVPVDEIADFVEITAKLGAAVDDISPEQAALELQRFANVAGTARDQMENLASSLVELGNTTAASEGEILNFASNMVAAGRQIGLTEADILALSASLTALGVNAEAGGTALQRTFLAIQDAVRTGSAELTLFAELAGQSAEDFARSFEEAPREAIQAFLEGINRANEAGESLTAVLDSVGLAERRTVRALLGAARAAPQLAENMDRANRAFRENTALTEEANRRFATTESQLKILSNTLQNAAADLGSVFLPAVNAVVRGLRGLTDAVASVPEPIQALTLAIIGFTGAAVAVPRVTRRVRDALDTLIIGALILKDRLAGLALTLSGPLAAALAIGIPAYIALRRAQEETAESTARLSLELADQEQVLLNTVGVVRETAAELERVTGAVAESRDRIAAGEQVPAAIQRLSGVIQQLGGDTDAFRQRASELVETEQAFGSETEVIIQKLEALARSMTSAREPTGGLSTSMAELDAQLKAITETLSVDDPFRQFIEGAREALAVSQDMAGETRTLKERLADLDLGVSDLHASLARQLPEGMERTERSFRDTGEAGDGFLGTLVDTTPELRRYGEEAEDAAASTDRLFDSISSLADLFSVIDQLASAVAGLADAFGLSSEAARGFETVVSRTAKLGTLGAQVAGPPGAAVGATLGFTSGLIEAIGPTARAQEIEALDAAILELTRDAALAARAADQLADSIGRDALEDALSAAGDVFAQAVGGEGLDALRKAGESFKDISAGMERDAARALQEMGLTVQDLIEISRAFGIELDDLIRFFETGKAKGDELANELDALGRVLGLIPSEADAATRALEAFASQLSETRRQTSAFEEVFDIEDASTQIRLFASDIVKSLRDETGGFADEFQPLISALSSISAATLGRFGFGPEDLESLIRDAFRAAPEEIRPTIAELDRLIEDFLEGLRAPPTSRTGRTGRRPPSPTLTPPEPEVRVLRSIQITELQGNDLLELQRSQLLRQEQIAENTRLTAANTRAIAAIVQSIAQAGIGPLASQVNDMLGEEFTDLGLRTGSF